jgi:uncharacterized membrane protein
VFLSYLSIIPGMAVFLVRIETDFVEYYDKFFDAVRGGGSLDYIESMRNEMVYAIQAGLGEIAKCRRWPFSSPWWPARPCCSCWASRSCTCRCCMCRWSAPVLQVGVMAVLNVFFYLDERRIVLCSAC